MDRSFLILDGPTDTRGVYVPMTRGRLSNEAFVVVDGNQTAHDLVGQALARSWIDEPALARRAQLQHAQAPGTRAGERATAALLVPEALRELFERDQAVTRSLTRLDLEDRRRSQELANAHVRRNELERSITEAQWRIDKAQQRLDSYDRPFRRHRHRFEIDMAAQTLTNSEATIERSRTELARVANNLLVYEQRDAATEALGYQRQQLEREQQRIRPRLDDDVGARVRRLAADPPSYVTERLGRRPAGGASASLWDAAAGRIDQHRAAFDVTDTRNALGPRPEPLEGARASRYRSAATACERVGRALGRGITIEPPHRGLGLEL